ncbi:lysozyme [Roseivivax halotolerans]|uniref:Lysozyme n=1 Tax=Roseivivax halotolerans TaxID=93684 RepID=A0A1I5W2V0_9RHOB|nr:lysozyme [Roseivivax halotolerans]SFQ14003.1 lysozyme [Roseivivax halotolerans]
MSNLTDVAEITDRGLLEIAEHEGIVPAPYRDSVGVWTWGLGHTAAAGGPDPSKMNRAMPNDIDAAIEEVLDQFRIDVARYARRVGDAVKVALKPYERDALVSFDLNTGGIYRAKLTAAINRGDADASRHFFGWLKPPEIRKRRTAEKRLFETGDYDANGDEIAIWRTNGQGKLLGVMTTIRGGELLERLHGKPVPDAGLEPLPDLEPVDEALRQVEARTLDLADSVATMRQKFDGVA